METTKITIHRTYQYANRLRKINVILNNKPLFFISNYETKTLELEEGKHTLSAKLDGYRSNQLMLDIQKGSDNHIEIGSSFNITKKSILISITRLVLLFGGIQLSKAIKNDLIFWGIFILIVASIIFEFFFSNEKSIFYYLTKGRNEYLYLKEI